MSTDTTRAPEALRYYTAGRRLQRFIAKLPGGGELPGGPYTMTQCFGGAVVLVVGYYTEGIWAQPFGWVTTQVVLVAVTVAVTLVLRAVKPVGRDPLSAGFSVLTTLARPVYGTYQGRPLRPGRSSRVRHGQILVRLDPPPESQSVDEPVSESVLACPVVDLTKHPSEPALPQLSAASPVSAAAAVTAPVPAGAGLSTLQRLLAGLEDDRRAS